MTGQAEPLAAIILAAGGSSRFGRPKQLFPVAGRGLLWRSVSLVAGLPGTAVTVVVGAQQRRMCRQLRQHPAGPHIVVNPRWAEGMSESMKAGLRSLGVRPRAALFMLCDQPRIRPADLLRLTVAWRARPDRVVAALYYDVLGAPAIFPRRYFPELLGLKGDRGAARVLAQRRHQVIAVPMARAAFDVDSPEDLNL